MDVPVKTCLGDGISPCMCKEYLPKPNLQDDQPELCRNCQHYSTSHPDKVEITRDARVASVMQRLQTEVSASRVQVNQAANGSTITVKQARLETNRGLRRSSKQSEATEDDGDASSQGGDGSEPSLSKVRKVQSSICTSDQL